MELISVIVPVYKVEKYLDRCVQSIVDQTYTNLEIILVDDGSPDNCPAMCDAWAAKDPRIKVIHKENGGGGGEARNCGIELAQGTYIGIVDSDDYIHPHMYAHLLQLMKDTTDIAECCVLETEEDDAQLDDGSYAEWHSYNTREAMRLHIADSKFRQTPPNKLYRRETIGDIRFPVGTRIDDEFWTYLVIGNARTLIHSSCRMYAYRQQPNSVMHASFSMARLQALEAKCRRLDYLKERFPELVSQARVNLWYTSLFMGQMSQLCLNERDRRVAFEKLYKVQKEYSLTKADRSTLPLKQRLWAYFSAISFEGTCRLRNTLKIGI